MAAKKKPKKISIKADKSKEVLPINKLKSVKKTLLDKKIRRYLVFATLLALFAGALYFGRGLFLVAIVDGKPITRLELVRTLEKQGGQQALDNLVTKKLISTEAEKQGVQVSQEDIQKEIDRINKLVESQGQTLDAALATQGQSRQTFEENIKIQKTVEELLEDETNVSDEDIFKYFESNKSLYGKDAKFEDLKEDIRQQLKQEKLSSAFQEWIQKLKNDSQVIYFVNF